MTDYRGLHDRRFHQRNDPAVFRRAAGVGRSCAEGKCDGKDSAYGKPPQDHEPNSEPTGGGKAIRSPSPLTEGPDGGNAPRAPRAAPLWDAPPPSFTAG